MLFLLNWLRPKTVPTPKRKSIPFWARIQCIIYSVCLKLLKKFYVKYAFSDLITIKGKPNIKIYHEYRDRQFESELKRLHIILSDNMIDVPSCFSTHLNRRVTLFYKCFQFSNTLIVDIDGDKITLNHGADRSFITTMKGCLKESDLIDSLLKYSFSGILKEYTSAKTESFRNHFSNQQESSSINRRISASDNSIFGNDPLFGNMPQSAINIYDTTCSTIKHLEGVSIDESF